MKHPAIALLVSLAGSTAWAVPYVGNLRLSSQAEVDAAAGYTEVSGSLTISGADIHDLGPLDGLTTVGSYVSISDNPGLTEEDGVFPALTETGGGIFLYRNTNMSFLGGFDALLQTGDNIDIWEHPSLVRVSGFSSLHTVGWSLEFGDNALLEQIPKFESLRTIASSLFLLDNPSLTRITSFEALQSVGWSFQVTGNTALKEVCGFHNFFLGQATYSGGGAMDIKNNGPVLPDPMTIADVVNAGPCPAPPSPLISRAGEQVALMWEAESGTSYYVSWSLDAVRWFTIAVGQVGTWSDPRAGESPKFYRLLR